MELSAPDALAWANGQSTWPAGYCLNFVWNAFGAPVTSPAGGYGNATAAWNNTHDKRAGRDAPVGFPVYFSGPDGHVALMKDPSRGILRSTYTSGGQGLVGDISIDTIVNGWGRTLLGWGADIFGYTISSTGTAGGGGTPITPEEEDTMYSLIKDAQSDAIFVGSQATGLRYQIANPYHVTLLQRYKVNNANDPMLVAELDIVASYLRLIWPTATSPAGLSASEQQQLVKLINDDAAARMAK